MLEKRRRIKVFKAADISKVYKDLFESYHNDSDLLAELLQNAMDSIRLAKPANPLIEIIFDKAKRRLIVRDNGLGMSTDELEDFALGRTKKAGKQFSSLGGEKGLGGAFVFGASDRFFIDTCKDGKRTLAECIGAYDRIMAKEEPEFYVTAEEEQRSPNYTEIEVMGKHFFMDFNDRDEIERMLRSYTAIGDTRSLFEVDYTECRAKLTWVDEEGEEQSKFVAHSYRHPLNDEADNDRVVDYADADTIENGFGRFLSYRHPEKQAIGIFGEMPLYEERQLPSGIVLSTKGYPTAVDITPPKTGYYGHWRYVLIVINDDDVVLDAGRKSVRRIDTRRIRNEIARDIFNALIKRHKKFLKTTEIQIEETVLDELKDQAKQLSDLPGGIVPYMKEPDTEHSVIALFHELVGAGVVKSYRTLSGSGQTRYDEIALYETPLKSVGKRIREGYKRVSRPLREKSEVYRKHITIEYKLDAADMMRDSKKELHLIDLLIAWDINKAKKKANWVLDRLSDEDRVFEGANYMLRNPFNDTCYVMLLKDFFK